MRSGIKYSIPWKQKREKKTREKRKEEKTELEWLAK